MKKIDYIHNFTQWEQEFLFYRPVKVRFSETDMFGHMNNTVPFAYFEDARIEYFSHLGFMEDWMDSKNETIIVVADLQCDFLQQTFFGDHLKVYVKANTLGNSSVDLHYLGKKDNGNICFVGRGTVVQISKLTGKSVPWNAEMKQAFVKAKNMMSH